MTTRNNTTLSESGFEQSKEDPGLKVCPECDGAVIVDEEHGETHCVECGLVVNDEEIDRGPEWRSFTQKQKDNRSRVGAPTTKLMADEGLTTVISWQDQDASGRSISAEKRSQMQRLRTWQQRIRTRGVGERNLQYALSEINRMASGLGIPKSIREVASVMYRRALKDDLLRGRSIEGVSTAVLYAATREENLPRSLDEMTEVSRVDWQEIARTYRYITSELGLQIEPTDPAQYLPRFCSELDLGPEIQEQAAEIIETTTEQGLHSGKSPTGYAAAAIYSAVLLSDEDVTQKAVAGVANVTEVTVRNRYQEQLEVMEFENPTIQ